MQPPKLLVVAAGLSVMGLAVTRADAQNQAPFTIRRPPDGATVREKVKVQIPLGSIPDGGYVAMYIDGDFRGALPITDEERKAIQDAATKNNEPAYFTYLWDTKAPVKVKFSAKEVAPAEGEHEITARLYAPKEGAGGGSILKETSSVKVQVQNKFDPGSIGPIKLQYRYNGNANREYGRKGASAVVAGLTQGLSGSDDQEIVSFDSRLAFGVEDVYPKGNAIVRNKMKRLELRQGGQVTVYPSEQLPNSLYQEVTPTGDVVYQNKTASLDQFVQMGAPVTATLELPKLPLNAVAPGDTWTSTGVSLEIPGMASHEQPKVSVTSTFVGYEWEGGYPCAKIHQSFDSQKGGMRGVREIVFGGYDVTSPTIKMDQDIFIAFRSGTLVKVDRKLEVVGKTTSAVGGGGGSSMGGMSSMGGSSMGMPGGMMGSGPSSSSYGSMMGQMNNQMRRGSSMTSGSGSGSAGYGSMMGQMNGQMRGRMGSGPTMGGGRGGAMGAPAGRGGGSFAPGGAGPSSAGIGGAGGIGGSAVGGGMGGMGGGATAPTQITLKSSSITELQPQAPAKTAGR